MIYEYFCDQVRLTPNKTALISEDLSVTYGGLLRLIRTKMADVSNYTKWAVCPVRSDIEGVVLLLVCAAKGISLYPVKFDTSHEMINATAETLRSVTVKESTQPFLILNTSGTTGEPKLIQLSQETKLARIRQFVKLYGITRDDTILVGTQLHMSMAQRLVLTALLNGATAFLLPRYSPELWHMAAKRCTVVVGVPMQLHHLTSDTRKIRLVLSSSAPRLPDGGELSATLNHAGVSYHECYGASEIAIATSGIASDSVGCAAPGATISVTKEGEILVKSKLLHSGYLGRPDLTQASLTEVGFFKTGDCGYVKNGKLFLTGRSSERVKVGGVTVWPADVENVVSQMPEVIDCAAVSIPDKHLGEVVLIYVVTDEQISLRDIQRFCTDKLTDAQIPRHCKSVGGIPRTELGKIQRRKL